MNDSKMKDVPFEDRFGMIVDVEYTSRKNNRLKRLIKNASFEQVNASIADIDYTSGRKLNKSLITKLGSCEYIADYRNIFITGATGSGKTYMACAFGMEACKQYFNALVNPACLIIDEIGRCVFDKENTRMFFDVIDRRYIKDGPNNIIFTSNKSPDKWGEYFSEDSSLLCALDRIFDDAMVFMIKGKSYRGTKCETVSITAGELTPLDYK